MAPIPPGQSNDNQLPAVDISAKIKPNKWRSEKVVHEGQAAVKHSMIVTLQDGSQRVVSETFLGDATKTQILGMKALKNLIKSVPTEKAKEILANIKTGFRPTTQTVTQLTGKQSETLGIVLIWPPRTDVAPPETHRYIWSADGSSRIQLDAEGTDTSQESRDIILHNFLKGTSTGKRMGYAIVHMHDKNIVDSIFKRIDTSTAPARIKSAGNAWKKGTSHAGLHKQGALDKHKFISTSTDDTRMKRAEEILKQLSKQLETAKSEEVVLDRQEGTDRDNREKTTAKVVRIQDRIIRALNIEEAPSQS